MADLPVSPIRLLASLRKLSKRFLVAEEELRIARDSWDEANLSTMESESAGSELPGVLAADEDRLEAAMMQLGDQFFEIEDTIDSVARDLAFVIPWPTDKIAEAIRRLETKIGLRPHRFTDGRTLADLQEFPCLVLAIDKTDWPSLALLPDLVIQDNAEASKEVVEQVTLPPLANGEKSGDRALAPDVEAKILRMIASGEGYSSYSKIAKECCCSDATIRKVISGSRKILVWQQEALQARQLKSEKRHRRAKSDPDATYPEFYDAAGRELDPAVTATLTEEEVNAVLEPYLGKLESDEVREVAKASFCKLPPHKKVEFLERITSESK